MTRQRRYREENQVRKTTEQHRNSVKYCEIQKRYIVILGRYEK